MLILSFGSRDANLASFSKYLRDDKHKPVK